MPSNPISQSNQFEFNDSVLETKAWNSSRYDGRQLSVKKINQATIDDIGNNNKTPIIRNYTRNIYIGNEIVGMTEENAEDPTLMQFPDFSYAQINTYITVNEDGTITKNTLNPEENTDTQKKAFYRPFLYDFPESSFCNFILGDPTVKNNLKSKYAIYFNGGQLKKVLTIQTAKNYSNSGTPYDGRFYGGLITSKRLNVPNNSAAATGLMGSSTNTPTPQQQPPSTTGPALYFGSTQGNFDAVNSVYSSPGGANIHQIFSSDNTGSLHNESITRTWFSGSLNLEAYKKDSTPLGKRLNMGEGGVKSFSEGFFNYKSNSTYKGDKRLFISVCKSHVDSYFAEGTSQKIGNPKPLYTFEPGNLHTSSLASQSIGIDTNNLNSLTTFEVQSYRFFEGQSGGEGRYSEFTFNPTLAESYIDGHTSHYRGFRRVTHNLRGKDMPTNLISGSFIFSVVDDDIPSLLVKLNKTGELQNGKGKKPFIVIPENIHPYVKDNLIFYLSKAGIDIGESATNKVEENTSKKLGAKRILTEAQLRELARRRREARLSRTRRGRRQLRQEERQNRREERREERRENRNERLKERNNRRENRRINKDNRKEKRQDKRENRRQNRRNRRRRK